MTYHDTVGIISDLHCIKVSDIVKSMTRRRCLQRSSCSKGASPGLFCAEGVISVSNSIAPGVAAAAAAEAWGLSAAGAAAGAAAWGLSASASFLAAASVACCRGDSAVQWLS